MELGLSGYDVQVVQLEVNRQLKRRELALKADETIAREVLQEKWNDGKQRHGKLKAAGYHPAKIQKIVNQFI